MKTCSNPACRSEYPATTEFFYYIKRQGRLSARCKACVKATVAAHKEKNKAQILERRRNSIAEKISSKKWQEDNRDKIRVLKAAWAVNNPEKRRAAAKKHRLGHADAIRLQKQQDHANNREKNNARSRRWMAENRERRRVYEQEYREKNPEKVRATGRRRRARELGAERVTLTRAQWEFIKRYHKYRCYYCGDKPKRLTQDHVVPLSKGGTHSMDNIIPACQSCNSKKWINPPPIPVQIFLDLAI